MFPSERINSTDNLMWVPINVHKRISSAYSRKDRQTGMTLRDMLNRLPWDEQYNRGLREVKRAWKAPGEQ
jgi:hypothetical protein